MEKRNTIQKQLVLDAVFRLANHPTAEEVYAEVARSHPTVSKATVYRNLGSLSEDGLLRHIKMPGGADGSTICFWNTITSYAPSAAVSQTHPRPGPLRWTRPWHARPGTPVFLTTLCSAACARSVPKRARCKSALILPEAALRLYIKIT